MSTPLTYESRSPRNNLPFLFAAQAQKELSVNEALARIDSLLRPAVEGELADPPADPPQGGCWIVGASAQGDWAGHEGEIAFNIAGTWLFAWQGEGMVVFDKALACLRCWRQGSWVHCALPSAPSGGTTVDSEARAAIAALIDELRDLGIGA